MMLKVGHHLNRVGELKCGLKLKKKFWQSVKSTKIFAIKKLNFFLKIQNLVSEYNKFTEENDLRKFIIFSKVVDVYDLPYNWNKDCETYIDDIVEYVSENPNWCSSSARC